MDEIREKVDFPRWWRRELEPVRTELVSELDARFFGGARQSLAEAMELAEEAHRHQSRKGGGPYIVHPFRVALSLMRELSGGEIGHILAALLHDVLEDSDLDRNRLAKRFGDEVAALVAVLTHPGRGGKRDDRLDQPYYQDILAAGDDAILVKAADKLDNLRDSFFHPNPQKMAVYGEEARRIFLPLIGQIAERVVREKLENAFVGLLQAMDGDQDQKTRAYFNRELLRFVDDLEPGESVAFKALSAKVFRLEDRLRDCLLANPGLGSVWMVADAVRLVKARAEPSENAVNVAQSYRRLLAESGPAPLIPLFSLSQPFLDPSAGHHWRRVVRQLSILEKLLGRTDPPAWLVPLLKDNTRLLQVIHSRMFMPASWTFPLWQRDYGAVLAEEDGHVYSGIAGDGKSERGWRRDFQWLLSEREALWRWQFGLGSAARAKRALHRLGPAPVTTPEYRERLAARLLAEFLDIATHPDAAPDDRTEKAFDRIWRRLKDPGVELRPLSGRGSRLLPEARLDPGFSGDLVELVNWQPVRDLCEKHDSMDALAKLAGRLIRTGLEMAKGHTLWLCFEPVEIAKRAGYFLEALDRVQSEHGLEDLGRLGIEAGTHRLSEDLVLGIAPGHWPALKNRLPEVEPGQMERLRDARFSAAAIFDSFLTEPLLHRSVKDPLWMPRVFRVLDTMADFNPDAVQKITVTFDAREVIEPFSGFLPLPRFPDESDRQTERKYLVARFLAATIFNYGNTIGIFGANVDCGPLAPTDQAHGFGDAELHELLRSVSESFGYGKVYGNFIQSFNFRKFLIETGEPIPGGWSFRSQDMGYGRFVGIDIGGTDTKLCFLEEGRVLNLSAEGSATVFTMATFEEGAATADAEYFCDRIIETVEKTLPQGWDPESIAGFGISWPGAVVDNRIVGTSGTLKRLRFPQVEGGVLDAKATPDAIQSADLAGLFRARLANRRAVWRHAALVLENDGNAEAYGNYCLFERERTGVPAGKIIVKLGTSLAGGFVDASGAIPPHVAEFSKLMLDFNVPASPDAAGLAAARGFVSSIGVRNLSRTFVFEDKPLFGSLGGQNDADENGKTRIEAVELGELLDFWRAVDREPLEDNTLLKEFAAVDGSRSGPRFDRLLPRLTQWLSDQWREWLDGKPSLLGDYVTRRGLERISRELEIPRDLLKRALAEDAGFRELAPDLARRGFPLDDRRALANEVRRRGCARLALLGSGTLVPPFDPPATLDETLPAARLAEKVLGTVALFSRFGLQIAHLIVAVYNIYRKSRMRQVILAGGVLGGWTGPLAKRQAEAFLAKYYDKVYGPDKNLVPGSILLARAEDPQAVGPMGAAMLANRRHKMLALAAMRKQVAFWVNRLSHGAGLTVAEILERLENSRVTAAEIREHLESFVARALLVPRREAGQTLYVKSLVP